jgi:hypothetical protein
VGLAKVHYRELEKWLIILIAAHSLVVGFFLLFLTRWGAALGGWQEVEPLFFARQAGIFHVVVAFGYLVEYFRHGTVTFLMVTKILAVLFLTGIMVFEYPVPWAVPLSAVGDGLMVVLVYFGHRLAAEQT